MLRFYTQGEAGSSDEVDVVATAGSYTRFSIPLSDLGNPGSISRLNFFNNSNAALETLSIDHLSLVPSAFFADGFELGDTSGWSSDVP